MSTNQVPVPQGYRILDVEVVVLNVSRSPWGYVVRLDTPKGEERFIVAGVALREAGVSLQFTSPSIVDYTAVRKLPDYSKRTEWLQQVFIRRFKVSRGVLIPVTLLAKILAFRYGSAFHPYKLSDGTVVIAPRGSAVKKIEFRGSLRPSVLCKAKNGQVTELSAPFMAIPADQVFGVSVDCVRLGYLMFEHAKIHATASDECKDSEIEYMLSHVLI